MKNEKLKDLLIDALLCDAERGKLTEYIKKNYKEISDSDFKKVVLSLLNQNNLFDYIPCCNYSVVIDNIDDDEFLNDEDNYF